jgi:hypothetical protein
MANGIKTTNCLFFAQCFLFDNPWHNKLRNGIISTHCGRRKTEILFLKLEGSDGKRTGEILRKPQSHGHSWTAYESFCYYLFDYKNRISSTRTFNFKFLFKEYKKGGLPIKL